MPQQPDPTTPADEGTVPQKWAAPIADIVEAQDAGAAAYAAGEPVLTCPYRGRTDEAGGFLRVMWVKGWTTARMYAENPA